MPTPQQKMKAALSATGLPYHEIECYGSQIVVTTLAQNTANKWALLLGRFATVRGQSKSRDDNKVNTGRRLTPDSHVVYRVFAAV